MRILLVWLCFGCLLPSVSAENWPCWRGPRGDGTSTETNLPVRWSETENIAWKTELPGLGHASPIVWEDRLFTVTATQEDEARVLLCLDRRSGQLLWQTKVLISPFEKKHRLNSFASSTPATDGELVYTAFLDGKEMVVSAHDFAGKQRWQVRPGVFSSKHGFCSCPVLFKDMVIVNGDHDGDAYLVALDRESGEIVWKTPRENKTRSYCTPIIRKIDGRTQMILSGSKCVASYDPNNGKRHWIIDGPTEQFVASPVYSHGLLFITGGFPDHHILAIDPRGSGNITDSHIIWRHRKGVSYVPSPVACGDYFVMVSDNGIGSCYEAKSGETTWFARIGRHFSASLVAAEGLAYILADSGEMTIVRPGQEVEIVAKNPIGEECYASPAISQGQIFLRTNKHLIAIGK